MLKSTIALKMKTHTKKSIIYKHFFPLKQNRGADFICIEKAVFPCRRVQ